MERTNDKTSLYPDISNQNNLYEPHNPMAESPSYDATPDSGVYLHDPSKIEEWKNELAKTEEEIATLQQVLSKKVKYAQELKRRLGISPWKEFREDMEQGLKNIQESTAYQKTSQTIKVAGEKTTSYLGSFTANVSKRIGEVKNSSTFKSFEERVGTAYESVKSKVVSSSSSRSNSTYSFDEALQDGRHSSGIPSSTSTPSTESKAGF